MVTTSFIFIANIKKESEKMGLTDKQLFKFGKKTLENARRIEQEYELKKDTNYVDEIRMYMDVFNINFAAIEKAFKEANFKEDVYKQMLLNIQIYIEAALGNMFSILINMEEEHIEGKKNATQLEEIKIWKERVNESLIRLKSIDEKLYERVFNFLLNKSSGKIIKHIIGEYNMDKKRKQLGINIPNTLTIRNYPHSYGVYNSKKEETKGENDIIY